MFVQFYRGGSKDSDRELGWSDMERPRDEGVNTACTPGEFLEPAFMSWTGRVILPTPHLRGLPERSGRPYFGIVPEMGIRSTVDVVSEISRILPVEHSWTT